MARHKATSAEVGQCEKCGKFRRWADMSHMQPDGSVIWCQPCIVKKTKQPSPGKVAP